MFSHVAAARAFVAPYAQRESEPESWLDRTGRMLWRPISHWNRDRGTGFERFVNLVDEQGQQIEHYDLLQAIEAAQSLRFRLNEKHLNDMSMLSESFALIRKISELKLGMRHHDVQLIGGLALLQSMIAEMQTGEGKTLTAVLAAGTVALSGVPVHVITVNDYLALRDAENMTPVYNALGLTVGVIQEGMEPSERQQIYASDIVYCSNKELAFDYLKDRIELGDKPSRIRHQLAKVGAQPGGLLLRGLYFAIVDEADSVMIDEARTPLVISAAVSDQDEKQVYLKALQLARQLEVNTDYEIFSRERYVQINTSGKNKLAELTRGPTGIWNGASRREMLVGQALSALHLFLRDRHYIVSDGKVEIVDEHTGRVMADRSWEAGLHQMIEAKENCELTSHRDTLARTSYQRFFKLYIHLSGMTGTAREVQGELWREYGLTVKPIPTFKPVRRKRYKSRILTSRAVKWDYVVSRILEIHQTDRPILVGTASVEASEQLSELLLQRAIPHQVLNARQDEHESELVTRAGQAGSIVIATSMAGRGTDIKLGDNVAENGGLHVIVTEMHESKRIDRQLIGRCARQGDPGSFEYILSLEDEIFELHGGWLKSLASSMAFIPGPVTHILLARLLRVSQYRAENFYARQRSRLIDMDEKRSKMLAFSGQQE